MAAGSSNSPPATSCQLVNVNNDTVGCHRRVSTVPKAMEMAPAMPAARPTGSRDASGVITNTAIPPSPTIADTIAMRRMGESKSK